MIMTQEDLPINNDYWSTPDLALAAAVSLWYPVDSIDRTNPTKALFLFKRNESLDGLIETFWKQELRVEPQAYFSQLKIIKSRLYGER
ncbi:MAG: Uncharacterized protein G01um101416_1064 [Microgenomates group bacterium Gr01-1014_16]|nr:MAG: Uncharacterized protein G01um101416_1064 [Microgenomates group bacterium Gr01-1014_16]